MKCCPLLDISLIKLTKGKYAIVDTADYEWLNQWRWRPRFRDGVWYAMRQKRNNEIMSPFYISMHRQILNPVATKVIDHINHDGLDNRRSNLRICTPAENSRNRIKQKRKASSKYKGVWKSRGKYWRASIQYNRKCIPIYLGHLPTEEQAALAYNEKAIELFGEFAHLNIIQP
jgi:hypothetical protein